ncbi:MAG: BlaI/MecI/CopY family transcriptional regulator [Thermoanaerobaculia bacterium]
MQTANALSRREREILDVLFSLGDEASAEDIRERLSDPPSYSAVRAILAKLEAKGAVKHRELGLKYVYSPSASRKTARKSALRRLVDVFFEGSKEQVVTALLNEEKWSDDELEELQKQIALARKERSRR